MRLLTCVASVLASDTDQESLLQTSSVKRHLLQQSEVSDEQLLANVRQHLESRANSVQALQHFEAAMETKPHKQGTCDAEAIEELTECLQIGNEAGHDFHLSDALAGTMTMDAIMASLASTGCDTLDGDFDCFKRSECFRVPLGKSDFAIPGEDGTQISAQSLCEGTDNSTQTGQVCALTPQALCVQYQPEIALQAGCEEPSGCEPVGEVEGLAVGICAETTGSDFYIRTEQGCKDAVEMYSEANLETLQAEMDSQNSRRRKKTVNIKYHKKLAKWRKKNSESQPMGCYLHFGGKGNKIRGYFNPYSALSDEDNRKADKTGSGQKKIETLCKTFA